MLTVAGVLSVNEPAPEMETSTAPFEEATVNAAPVAGVTLGKPDAAAVALSTGVETTITGGVVMLKVTPAGGIMVVEAGMDTAVTDVVAPACNGAAAARDWVAATAIDPVGAFAGGAATCSRVTVVV